MKRFIAGAAALLCGAASANAAQIIADFEDGTTQGFLVSNSLDLSSFTGTSFVGAEIVNAAGGNPGRFLLTNDLAPQQGTILVKASDAFTGDLSGKGAIVWDEIDFDGLNRVFSQRLFLVGQDGTTFVFDTDLIPLNVWTARSASLTDASVWTLLDGSGSSSFADVVGDVAAVIFRTEVGQNTNRESGLDNVGFLVSEVPVPAAALLFPLGVAGVLRRRAR
ncbi:hypothetical protein [Parvularcula maris]|uniref:PEP-CTERM sorting domain-containing protein n=1 Tax=Parvularcula maris TaxID=2965077 RepID=A0A9X2L6S4_9PROT|nr:hypothetical protein [Parvularcula maris]MCQ8184077.1 hypothetical protein [Parvularcula maris]